MEENKNEQKVPKSIKINGKEYHLYNRLQGGSYGKVCLIEDAKDNKFYALKILTKNEDENIEDFNSEIEIYQYFNKINNKYIPRIYDSDIIKINQY